MSQLGKHALAYAERLGRAVFPLRPGAKEPRTGHGFKDATTDAAQLEAWWRETPLANIGMPVPPGYVVLDVDSQEALEAMRYQDMEVPATVTARTPRGWHFWFRTEAALQPRVGIIEGVDLRAPGSYVVVPPSRLSTGGEYTWEVAPKDFNYADAPTWLAELGKHQPFIVSEGSQGIKPAEVLVGVGEGFRDVTLFRYACRLRALGYDRAEAEVLVKHAASACSPPLSPFVAVKKLDSAWKYEGPKTAPDSDAKIWSLGELLGTEFPEPRWLIQEILPEGLSLVFSPAKIGKALALDTPIATPGGWTTQGELRPGDEVFGADGKPRKVLAATEAMCGRPCYRVRMSTGDEIVADAEHEWLVSSVRPEGFVGVRTTAELATDVSEKNKRSGAVRHTHRIRVHEPLEMPAADLLIDPYVLGAWLGDGTGVHAMLTVADEEIVENVRAAGVSAAPRVQRGAATTYRLGGLGGTGKGSRGKNNRTLQADLRRLGVLGNKHIPTGYLRASEEQRRALLQGLMDTDGHCTERGMCELTTVDERLRDDALELIRSLGLKASCTEGRATIAGRDCGAKYRISFTCYSDRPAFRLGRKASRLRPRPDGHPRSLTDSIEAVEAVPSVPVKCIQVEGGLYLAGRSMTVTHNSFLVGAACAAIASGRIFLRGFLTARSEVLYLDLEQGESFAQQRWRSILGSKPCPDEMTTAFRWPRMDKGGLDRLEQHLETHPNVGVVVIDVLAMFWPEKGSKGGENAYIWEYKVLSQIRELAQRKGCAIVLVHHTNRSTPKDPLDKASGTQAMTGVPDGAIWVLSRERSGDDGELYVVGKNVMEQKLEMRFNASTGGWCLSNPRYHAHAEYFEGIGGDPDVLGGTQ